jgi:DNA-binding PucR family transcriptional regulator
VRVVALSEAGAYEYMLLSADPMLTRMVSRDLRAALDPSTTDGAATAETARAYLECDLSARDAAERLFVHLNTLRYRLHQLEERAGIDLKRFADLVELRIALDFSDPPRSPELPRP